MIIGRFQKASKIDKELLVKSIRSKDELKDIPIIANVDFGHTDPKVTFPIGGMAAIRAVDDSASVKIIEH